MFEKIKRKFLKKKTDKNLLNRDLSQRNVKIKTLGFLVDETIVSDFDMMYGLFKEMKLQPKDVKVYSFLEVKKKLPTLVQNRINNKDFTWKGEILNQNAVEFLDTSFDTLMGYYNRKNDFLDMMMSRSKAKFKAGFMTADDRLFDLQIDVDPNDFEAFKSEFIKYLKILNKI